MHEMLSQIPPLIYGIFSPTPPPQCIKRSIFLPPGLAFVGKHCPHPFFLVRQTNTPLTYKNQYSDVLPRHPRTRHAMYTTM